MRMETSTRQSFNLQCSDVSGSSEEWHIHTLLDSFHVRMGVCVFIRQIPYQPLASFFDELGTYLFQTS